MFVKNENGEYSLHVPKPRPVKKIPAGFYSVQNKNGEIVLTSAGKSKLLNSEQWHPELKDFTKTVIDTYNINSKNNVMTGVMLAGWPLLGKTVQIKALAEEFVKQGGIVISFSKANVVNGRFQTFLDRITQPCMILSDNIQKLYDSKNEKQHGVDMVEFLKDITYIAKGKLVAFTADKDTTEYSHYFTNNPSVFQFGQFAVSLSRCFVDHYLNKCLAEESKRHRQGIINIYNSLNGFNFSHLELIVQQANIYPEKEMRDLLKHLNICTTLNLDNKTGFTNTNSSLERRYV